MMSEQDLADVVQIAVEDLSPHHPGTELWESKWALFSLCFTHPKPLPEVVFNLLREARERVMHALCERSIPQWVALQHFVRSSLF